MTSEAQLRANKKYYDKMKGTDTWRQYERQKKALYRFRKKHGRDPNEDECETIGVDYPPKTSYGSRGATTARTIETKQAKLERLKQSVVELEEEIEKDKNIEIMKLQEKINEIQNS